MSKIHDKNFPFNTGATKPQPIKAKPVTPPSVNKKRPGFLRRVLILLLLSLVGYGAYYFFSLGKQQDEVKIRGYVTDVKPFKRAPEDEGGKVIRHLDKTIYENINKDDGKLQAPAKTMGSVPDNKGNLQTESTVSPKVDEPQDTDDVKKN